MPPIINPRDWAIVVGIDDYVDVPDFSVDSLHGCVNDAKLFQQWLELPQGGGLDPQHIRLIISDHPRPNPVGRPVKDEIEDEIIRFIEQHNREGRKIGRRLYLWFSGHGVTPAREPDECALLMANASQLALTRSFPGRRAAHSIRGRSMFDEVVLFMDCCRTMAGLEATTVSFEETPLSTASVRALHGFSTSTLAASSEQLLPHPFDQNQAPLTQGVFAHAVLDGLRRGTNSTGRIDSDSLARYVRERTQQLLPPEDNQRPTFDFDDRFPIDFGPGEMTQVEVALANPAEGFQIREGLELLPVLNLRPAQRISTVRLAPGRYLFGVPGVGDSFASSRIVEVLGAPVNVSL